MNKDNISVEKSCSLYRIHTPSIIKKHKPNCVPSYGMQMVHPPHQTPEGESATKPGTRYKYNTWYTIYGMNGSFHENSIPRSHNAMPIIVSITITVVITLVIHIATASFVITGFITTRQINSIVYSDHTVSGPVFTKLLAVLLSNLETSRSCEIGSYG